MSLSVLIAFIPTLTNNGIVQKKSEYLIQKLVTFESIQKHILYNFIYFTRIVIDQCLDYYIPLNQLTYLTH